MQLIILITLICIIKSALKSPILLGKIGEARVDAVLKSLPEDEYYVFKNLLVNVAGRSVQIDHVVLSTFGIFVIEVKNYTGIILGKENEQNWTKVMYSSKYTFENPTRQNYGHQKALESLFDLPSDKFFPIVVFANKAKLKCDCPRNRVINQSDLIQEIMSRRIPILYKETVCECAMTLAKANSNLISARIRHVSNLNEQAMEKEAKAASGICPRCGGKLVVRIARNGSHAGQCFLGCANYPRCRYTRNYN